MALKDWSSTAGSNLTVGGVSIAEGWSPSSVNNAIRGLMAEVAVASFATFNVMDYGATGDGATDDTTSFNSAIDAVIANGGGTLVIPTNTYAVSLNWGARVAAAGYTGIVVEGNNSILLGIGGQTQVLKLDRGGSGTDWTDSLMTFRDLTFLTEANACSGGTPVINYALYLSRSTAKFSNCKFYGGAARPDHGFTHYLISKRLGAGGMRAGGPRTQENASAATPGRNSPV